MARFTFSKFTSLIKVQQHKHLASLLKQAYLSDDSSLFEEYLEISSWIHLCTLPYEFRAIADRYHYHYQQANLPLKEHNFLPRIHHQDKPDGLPFLPYTIYLDSLRLAQNVGSIIRTTEAFRLGNIYFGGTTPFIDQKKVQDAAMGATKIVDCHQDPKKIIDPIIAVETIEGAIPYYQYTFPERATLVFGNEEYGISEKIQKQANTFVYIPMQGQKNSINVACAFSVIASFIQQQKIFIS